MMSIKEIKALLDEGKIVEAGTHDQLIGKNGIYARINSIQASLQGKEE